MKRLRLRRSPRPAHAAASEEAPEQPSDALHDAFEQAADAHEEPAQQAAEAAKYSHLDHLPGVSSGCCHSGRVCLAPRRSLRTARKVAIEAPANAGALTSRGARFPVALRPL